MIIDKPVDLENSNYLDRSVFKIIYNGDGIQEASEQFFSTISGLKGIKENFYRALASDERVNILLVGHQKVTKSKLINHIKDQCHDVFYFNASVSSGSQLINSLQGNRLAKVIIIENMDKLRKNYLSSIHRLVDKGRIRQVKLRDIKMDNIKVFATVESLDKLTPQLRSRFMAYRIL